MLGKAYASGCTEAAPYRAVPDKNGQDQPGVLQRGTRTVRGGDRQYSATDVVAWRDQEDKGYSGLPSPASPISAS
jgi:hypothetical protein